MKQFLKELALAVALGAAVALGLIGGLYFFGWFVSWAGV